MEKAKFFRDYKHSYMILPCGLIQPDKNYQCRMLMSNRSDGLLHCSLRHVNGAVYFYYDISSRTTLESLYRGRRISFQQVKELFMQLYEICGGLGDSFMDERKLVLLPQYIYYDLSRKKYIGLYYPDYEEDKPYEALMDYLLEHMDGQDERLADFIYQIYERTEDSAFSLHDALQLLGEQEEADTETPEPKRSGNAADLGIASVPFEPVDFEPARSEPAHSESVRSESAHSEFARSGSVQFASACSAGKGKKNWFSIILIIFSFFGIAGIVYVYGVYELSDEEMTMLLGCSALLGVCILAGIAGALKGKGKKEKAMKTQETPLPEEEWSSAVEPISLERVLSRDREPLRDLSDQKEKSGLWEEQEDCGDTVFFDHTKRAEHKLYALDRKNKKHIELTHFPYTVGKMAGCVDCVLADESVSRIHARFERDKEVIRLTDLNSTNGTFKNGRRLQPQETVEMEPGDEIRFGNLNYCYR